MFNKVGTLLLVLQVVFAVQPQTDNLYSETAQQAYQFESRKIRQLDLGLQDVTYSSEKPFDTITNLNTKPEIAKPKASANPTRGYLPPAPPTPIEPAPASNDETRVRPDTEQHDHHHHPHHHGRDLCTDPFHSFLCEKTKPRKRITGALPSSLQEKKLQFTGNSLLGANSIPEPSKVLAPPDNHIYPYPANQPEIRLKPSTQRPTTKLFTYFTPTTTLAPTTTTSPSTTTEPITTTEVFSTEPTDAPVEPAPSNENLRAYLPPKSPQPSKNRIMLQPAPSNKIANDYLPPQASNTNFNLFKAPLKPSPKPIPREYIPVVPQPTNNKVEIIKPKPKTPPREYLPVEEPAPTNNNPNIYKAPKNEFETAAAQNDIRVEAAHDHGHHGGNHDHHHHHRDICSDPFHSFLCQPLKKRVRITGALPNNLIAQNTFLQSRRVLPTSTKSPDTSIVPAAANNDYARLPFENILVKSNPSKSLFSPAKGIDRDYLPPRTTTKTINYAPFSTTLQPRAITTQRPTTTTTTTRRTTPQPRPTTTTQRPRPPTTTQRPKPSPVIVPQPSNEINRAYLPPSTRAPIFFKSTSISPEPSNNIINIYSPTTKRPTTVRPITRSPQASNPVNAYLPPKDPAYDTAAAQNDPAILKPDSKNEQGSHGYKDVCSDPFHSFLCQTPKKRNRITGNLPDSLKLNPDTSNINLQAIKFVATTTTTKKPFISSTTTRKPFISSTTTTRKQFINTTTRKPYTSTTPRFFTRTYRPITTIKPNPSIIPQPGSFPSNRIPININPTIPPKNILETRVVETILKPAEARNNPGYSYPKPESEFTLPTEQKGYEYPKPQNEFPLPSNIKPEIVVPAATTQNKGYDYPKPDVQLPLPSEQNSGYNYPKPDTQFPLPSEEKKGYEYPKPQREFPLPSEKKEYTAPNITPSSTNEFQGYDYPKPAASQTSNGYDYPKPAATQSEGYQYPKPAASQQNGYNYPKPNEEFRLPSTQQENRFNPNIDLILPNQLREQRALTGSRTYKNVPQSYIPFESERNGGVSLKRNVQRWY